MKRIKLAGQKSREELVSDRLAYAIDAAEGALTAPTGQQSWTDASADTHTVKATLERAETAAAEAKTSKELAEKANELAEGAATKAQTAQKAAEDAATVAEGAATKAQDTAKIIHEKAQDGKKVVILGSDTTTAVQWGEVPTTYTHGSNPETQNQPTVGTQTENNFMLHVKGDAVVESLDGDAVVESLGGDVVLHADSSLDGKVYIGLPKNDANIAASRGVLADVLSRYVLNSDLAVKLANLKPALSAAALSALDIIAVKTDWSYLHGSAADEGTASTWAKWRVYMGQVHIIGALSKGFNGERFTGLIPSEWLPKSPATSGGIYLPIDGTSTLWVSSADGGYTGQVYGYNKESSSVGFEISYTPEKWL